MLKARVIVAVVLLALISFAQWFTRSRGIEHPEVCGAPRLRTAEARQAAAEKGYEVDPRYDCPTKASMQVLAMVDSIARSGPHTAKASPAAAPIAPTSGTTLAEARRGFATSVSQTSRRQPLPTPPAQLFIRGDYTNTTGSTLAAFVTPDPRDGRKHPAIIWITGGDSNTLDDFWTPGPPSHDESASAFRDAGMVMMYPTLRGGNENGGSHEYFYGEVDDILAAADRLASLPYVDPAQIYLGGHSTGGTLALLTAETSNRFKAVFAFGPATDVSLYPESIVPVSFAALDPRERALRSPLNWLHGITSPTYIIEGRVRPSNVDDAERLCAATNNPMVKCVLADGVDHFAVLRRVTPVIAARLSVAGDIPFQLAPSEFSRKQ